MKNVLSKLRSCKLVDEKYISDVEYTYDKYQQFYKYKDIMLPYVSCGSVKNHEICMVINFICEKSECKVTSGTIDEMASGLVTDKAIFFDIPSPYDKDKRTFFDIADHSDLLLFITNVKSEKLLPAELNYLNLISEAVNNHPWMIKKMIFVLYSDSAVNENHLKKIQNRKDEIIKILGQDLTKIIHINANSFVTGQKTNDPLLVAKSGIPDLRNALIIDKDTMLQHHNISLLSGKKQLQVSLNHLIVSLVEKHDKISKVLTTQDNIENSIKNILDSDKRKILEIMHNLSKIFSANPTTENINFDFSYDHSKIKNAKKRDLLTISENILNAFSADCQNKVYAAAAQNADIIKTTLAYQNIDNNCFTSVINSALQLIKECIDVLDEHCITLYSSQFVNIITFKQEQELDKIMYKSEITLRDYVLPLGPQSLEKYKEKLIIAKQTSELGINLFNVKYNIENMDEILMLIQDDINTNWKRNRDFLWNSIILIYKKFVIDLNEKMISRMKDLDEASYKVYTNPMFFNNLKRDKETILYILRRINGILSEINAK